MLFIGDVHGKFIEYARIVGNTTEPTLQVGDMGVFREDLMPFNLKNRFIRGNHDNPERCKRSLNYLGDWGQHRNGIFYVSGAWSIDQSSRMTGFDWWPDEELSYSELSITLSEFTKRKPKIVVSHDCPEEFRDDIVHGKYNRPGYGPAPKIPTKTSRALQAMWESHRPLLWIFGHHHKSIKETYKGCEFICLNELETFNLPNFTWEEGSWAKNNHSAQFPHR